MNPEIRIILCIKNVYYTSQTDILIGRCVHILNSYKQTLIWAFIQNLGNLLYFYVPVIKNILSPYLQCKITDKTISTIRYMKCVFSS